MRVQRCSGLATAYARSCPVLLIARPDTARPDHFLWCSGVGFWFGHARGELANRKPQPNRVERHPAIGPESLERARETYAQPVARLASEGSVLSVMALAPVRNPSVGYIPCCFCLASDRSTLCEARLWRVAIGPSVSRDTRGQRLWWASSGTGGGARGDASAREALRQIALHGRVAMPAGNLGPDDLAQNPRQVGPPPAFLPRRLRRFQDTNPSEFWAADAIPPLLPREGRHDRRIALVGAASMGKTRLVHELVRHIPPETIVFAPSRNLRNLSDADLRHATRYLGGRSCVLVFDDLNFYVGRTDVAELAQVVAEQAAICSIAVTCTTSTLSQVRNEAEPALSRFFSTLDQYEILRMTDAQMEVLAADPAGRTTRHDPHDCGGNPGLLLLDSQRLREEFNSLSPQEVAVLKAIHALFVAGISPIRIQQVSAMANSGFGAVLDLPIVSGALEHLYSMSFIRERAPVVPEEAFLREVIEEDVVRTRMDEVEGVLLELRDARGLSQLGVTLYFDEDFERSSRVMRLAVHVYRAAGTPESLVNAARTLSNLGVTLAGWERAPDEIETAYHDAAAAGREAAIPEGLVEKARALFNLGVALAGWGRAPQEIEAAWREAAAAGREAAIPEGLEVTARALFNLGNGLEDWERSPQEIETARREAAAAGTRSCHPRRAGGDGADAV